MTFFSCFMKWNWRPLSLKSCQFEASKDIKTKFKPQALHIIRIKYWNPSGSGKPPSLIPALRKIAILGLKTGLWQWHNGISVILLLFNQPCLHVFWPLSRIIPFLKEPQLMQVKRKLCTYLYWIYSIFYMYYVIHKCRAEW